MYFPLTGGLLRRKIGEIRAVDDVSFTVRRGETLGLCGESGCGKSTIARCIVRLYKPTGGRVLIDGMDVTRMHEKQLRGVRARSSLVFQDSYSALNPRQNVRSIITEPLRVHRIVDSNLYQNRALRLCEMVGLGSDILNRYPHELSGGQRQRVGIARALASEPSLIVCDEPLSALDLTIQVQIIRLLQELQDKRPGLTYIFISHDLSVIRHLSDKVAVMYQGRIIELADTHELYSNPIHPYTEMLLSTVLSHPGDPFLEPDRRIELNDHENMTGDKSGCGFHARCDRATQNCRIKAPKLMDLSGGHMVACMNI
jgi:oligopeptide/dipeptide ABC transporter ATP-binding protein